MPDIIIQLEDNLFQVTKEDGTIVYQSSCEAVACGMPMFMRSHEKPYICRECEVAYLNEIKEGRLESLDDLPIIRDPRNLLMIMNQKTPKFKGRCEYHPTNFGCELEVERNTVSPNGHYVCFDCERLRQKAYDVARLARLRQSKEENHAV